MYSLVLIFPILGCILSGLGVGFLVDLGVLF